ncbi:alkaline-phosphatase-like protein [Lineolata rhizophorae]|uniref:Alkaline phosphatase n=1 Tax=Lineolata rhizophorae TaxID=578093 RepID=A0A6A6NSZ8_9PEZI|nr:alkaline-phosphatase-like protein [Lineolata rhizophorae]
MPAGEEPLLSHRPSSELSADRDLAEEDALLTGRRNGSPQAARSRRWARWREILTFAWALIATIVVIVLAVVYQKKTEGQGGAAHTAGKRNLVFMVSDGMGPTSLSMTRSFRQYQLGLPYGETLSLDKFLVGQSRTRSTSSLVTDSAAGATAFSCGLKSYNGAIAVLDDHSPCGTVLEAAKKAGYMTGLVVTTRITDATPACFAAHVNMRSEEDRIAEQLVGDYPLGRVVDLILGGGRCHFLPNSTEGSCRDDNKDIVKMAKDSGFNYVHNRADFDGLNMGSAVNLPMLGLLADTDIPYEVDRQYQENTYPSLDEMARTALAALSAATQDSDKGFFLMIEGSRIDHAGHANDPVAQVHEVLAYDNAMSSVVEFLQKDTVPGVMVSTSDHETGGLAAARQLHSTYPDYLWYPGVLANASRSAEWLGREYYKEIVNHPDGSYGPYLKRMLEDALGVRDYSDDEIQSLIDSPEISPYLFADIVSRRSQIGWTTHGHSAVDVNIYAHPAEAATALSGNHENTEVGDFLRSFLDVDVDAITRKLKAEGVSHGEDGAASSTSYEWMGPLPEDGERLDGQDHTDHYQGDFKKHKRCEICGV